MKTAILYARVESDPQDERFNSLDYQINQLGIYCKRKNIESLRVYSEIASGESLIRQEFQKAIKHIELKHEHIDYFLFLNTGIISNNSLDYMCEFSKIAKMNVEPIAIAETVNFTKVCEFF